MNSLTHGDANANSTDNKQTDSSEVHALKNRMKVQRVYNNASNLMLVAETLLNESSNISDIDIDEKALNEINEEITKLQDRLTQVVKKPT